MPPVQVQVFNVTMVMFSVPEDIHPEVVVDWIEENYSCIRPVRVGRVVHVYADDHTRLNNFVSDLQESAGLLRRRTVAFGDPSWAR